MIPDIDNDNGIIEMFPHNLGDTKEPFLAGNTNTGHDQGELSRKNNRHAGSRTTWLFSSHQELQQLFIGHVAHIYASGQQLIKL